MSYHPSTLFLKELEDRLTPLGYPIHFKLPKTSITEPFVVVGVNTSNTAQTAQNGLVIEELGVQVDIFLDNTSRTLAEEVRSRAIRLLGRSQSITSRVLMDDSVGREVFHIVIQFTKIIY